MSRYSVAVARGVGALVSYFVFRQLYVAGYEWFAYYSAVAAVAVGAAVPLAGYWAARRGWGLRESFAANLLVSAPFYLVAAALAYRFAWQVAAGIVIGWIAYSFAEPLYYLVYTTMPYRTWPMYVSFPLLMLPIAYLAPQYAWLGQGVGVWLTAFITWLYAGRPKPPTQTPGSTDTLWDKISRTLHGAAAVGGAVLLGVAFNESFRLGVVERVRVGVATIVESVVVSASLLGVAIYSRGVRGERADRDYYLAAAAVVGAAVVGSLFVYAVFASTGKYTGLPGVQLMLAWGLAAAAGSLARLLGEYRRGVDEERGQLIVSLGGLGYAAAMLGAAAVQPTLTVLALARSVYAAASATIYSVPGNRKWLLPVYAAAAVGALLALI